MGSSFATSQPFREIIDDGVDVREVMYACNKAIKEEMAYQRDALSLE